MEYVVIKTSTSLIENKTGQQEESNSVKLTKNHPPMWVSLLETKKPPRGGFLVVFGF
jgi:hypothetical protein